MLDKIYDPLGDGLSSVEHIQHCGSDRMIVNAARVSYGRDASADEPITDRDRNLIKFMLDHRHGTPFEHNLITYRVKAPLYVIQEMLRHRIGVSFNQQSHRYMEPGRGEVGPIRKFYVPNIFRYQDEKNRQGSVGQMDEETNAELRDKYINCCESAFDTYEELIENGVCREQARGVLPHSTYSSLYVTVNLRSLMHFMGLRLAENAQWEIRQYAKSMCEIGKDIFPTVYGFMDFFSVDEKDGIEGSPPGDE